MFSASGSAPTSRSAIAFPVFMHRSSGASPVPRVGASLGPRWDGPSLCPVSALLPSGAVLCIHGSCSQFIGVRPASRKDRWNAPALTDRKQRGVSRARPESTGEYRDYGKHRQECPGVCVQVSNVISKIHISCSLLVAVPAMEAGSVDWGREGGN